MKNDELHIVMMQVNPLLGDLEGQANRVFADLAKYPRADILFYPELFLIGYQPLDMAPRPNVLAQQAIWLEKIRERVVQQQGAAVLIGACAAGRDLPSNSMFLITPNGQMRRVDKIELANRDIYNEQRVFASAAGQLPLPLIYKGFNLGVMICEDMWHGRVARGLLDEGAEVLLVANGSAYERGKKHIRIKHARNRVRETGLPLVYLNMVGGQDGEVYDGGSFTMNVDGSVMQGPAFIEAEMHIRLHRLADGRVHIASEDEFPDTPYSDDTLETDYAASILGLGDYIRKSGFKRAVIGMSGGVDSALAMIKVCDAIGAENVIGVKLPGYYTSALSNDLADQMMGRLGVHAFTLPIGPAIDVLQPQLGDLAAQIAAAWGLEAKHDIADENMQARLRGLALMDVSNRFGAMLISTGNKSETLLGFSTIYGDMCGGFNAMKSFYKTRVYELCRWRNAATGYALQNPIPEGILTRAPSAELKPGQVDQDSLGSYEAADFVLMQMVEGGEGAETAAFALDRHFGANLGQETGGRDARSYTDMIERRLVNSEFKRRQAAPGIKITSRDTGAGFQLPIAGKRFL